MILLSPWTQTIFGLAPFDPEHWLIATGLGLLPLPAMEAWKAGLRRREQHEKLQGAV
jgi:hypothetical protein